MLWRLGKYSTLFRNSKLESFCWLRMFISPSDLIRFYINTQITRLNLQELQQQKICGSSQWIFHSHVEGPSQCRSHMCHLPADFTFNQPYQSWRTWGQLPLLPATDWLSVKITPTLIRIVTITKQRPWYYSSTVYKPWWFLDWKKCTQQIKNQTNVNMYYMYDIQGRGLHPLWSICKLYPAMVKDWSVWGIRGIVSIKAHSRLIYF